MLFHCSLTMSGGASFVRVSCFSCFSTATELRWLFHRQSDTRQRRCLLHPVRAVVFELQHIHLAGRGVLAVATTVNCVQARRVTTGPSLPDVERNHVAYVASGWCINRDASSTKGYVMRAIYGGIRRVGSARRRVAGHVVDLRL